MLSALLGRLSFNAKHRETLYKTISDYVSSGLSVSEYIYKARKRYALDKNTLFHVYDGIYTRLSEGRSLSEAFYGYVPHDEHAIISSVDKATDKAVADIFDNLCDLVGNKISLNSSIVNFNLYLIFALVAGTPVALKMMAELAKDRVQGIESMLNLNRLPSIMQYSYETYIPFMIDYYFTIWIVFVVFIIFGWFLVLYLPNSSVRRFLDKSPLFFPFYIYATYKSFIFLVTAGVYNRSGFDIASYVKVLEKEAQPYEKSIYSQITSRLDSGSYSSGESLTIGWLPKEVEYRVEDYASSSEFGVVIEKITTQMIKSICERILAIIVVLRWFALFAFITSFGLIIGLLYSLSSAIG